MFESPVFLMKLHKTFPVLETLVYKGVGEYQGTWTFGTLLPVLQSLGNVKNLHLTDCVFDLGRVIQPHEELDAIFEMALEVINKKFPKHSTDLLIIEREHGFWLMKDKGKDLYQILETLKKLAGQIGPFLAVLKFFAILIRVSYF